MYVEVVHNACMHIYTEEASVNKRVVYQDGPRNAKKANYIKKIYKLYKEKKGLET